MLVKAPSSKNSFKYYIALYTELVTRMQGKQTIDYAREAYSRPGKNYLKIVQLRLHKIASLVGSNKRVLDVGCFDGTCGELLLKNGNEVYGLEVCQEAASLAEKKGLKVKIGDLESGINYPDGSFDVVVAGEIIEHILDTDFFLEEIKRVLRPNGFLVLSTPNAASLGRRILLLLGKNPFYEASFGFPINLSAGHVRFFTKGLLFDFLEYKGFTVEGFQSDGVNFGSSGDQTSKTLANIFPSLGGALIVKAKISKKALQQ